MAEGDTGGESYRVNEFVDRWEAIAAVSGVDNGA